MNQDNYVIFKKSKNGISIHLDKQADTHILREQLIKKMEDTSKFFKGIKTNITFKGKTLTEEEELEFLNIICEKTNMNITFVQSETEPSKNIPFLLGEALQQHNITKYFKGNIRSGQVLTFDGSVIILGDVNPGAMVRATGNIIVLGALKGTAHAGYHGMTDAFIAALAMSPVQLRIADLITRFSDIHDLKEKGIAEYAYIEDKQIYVVPLS